MTPLVKDIIMSSTRMPALFLGHGSPMNVHCHARKRLWWFRLTGLPVEQE